MYRPNALNVQSYANGFTLWHYDAQGEDLMVPNYFGEANDPWPTLKAGDFILWSDKTGARGGMLLVSVAAQGRALVTPLLEAQPVRIIA